MRVISKTDAQFGNAIVDTSLTYELISEQLNDSNDLYLFPGFVASSNQSNQVTTLGKGALIIRQHLLLQPLRQLKNYKFGQMSAG